MTTTPTNRAEAAEWARTHDAPRIQLAVPTLTLVVADLLRWGVYSWEDLRTQPILVLRRTWANYQVLGSPELRGIMARLICEHGHWSTETCNRCASWGTCDLDYSHAAHPHARTSECVHYGFCGGDS